MLSAMRIGILLGMDRGIASVKRGTLDHKRILANVATVCSLAAALVSGTDAPSATRLFPS